MTASPPRASILAIGTELTSGQIINSNAGWISQQLEALGIPTVLHMTVPDERPLIRMALETCQNHSDLLFVCGGLGPTTDDFTREIIAEWVAQPLHFHPPSWERIVQRMARMAMPLVDSQKQQCYFPQTATVLENVDGTANAFYLEEGDCKVWVLPGPPLEIAAIWNHSIGATLQAAYPHFTPLKPLTWDCMGQGESVLGEAVEKAIAGSTLTTGYRAHFPYVEVKIWCPQGDEAANQPYLKELESVLAPWVITRNAEDLVHMLLQRLQPFAKVQVLDGATEGYLAERIGAALKKNPALREQTGLVLETQWLGTLSKESDQAVLDVLMHADPTCLTLVLVGFTAEGNWAIGKRHQDEIRFEVCMLPPHRLPINARTRQLAGEMALNAFRRFF